VLINGSGWEMRNMEWINLAQNGEECYEDGNEPSGYTNGEEFLM
jgi:hypothetical protein